MNLDTIGVGQNNLEDQQPTASPNAKLLGAVAIIFARGISYHCPPRLDFYRNRLPWIEAKFQRPGSVLFFLGLMPLSAKGTNTDLINPLASSFAIANC